MNYKRTRLHRPYNEDGSTAFPVRGVPGCYLIYKVTEHHVVGTEQELRYVGYGGKDVYKALYRHFQTWNDRNQQTGEPIDRVVYKVRGNIRVRVIYCKSAAQAKELETALILKHRPKDNPDKLTQLEITPAGEDMARAAFDAEIITNDAVPF